VEYAHNGVRCWFAPEDLKIGDRIRDTIDQQIRLQQKLLVVLSSASLISPWVEDEVEAALEKERTSPERRTVLVPITIDHAVDTTNCAWARKIKRTRHIGDFTHWDDAGEYQKAFERLLHDLQNTASKPSG
jgi:TIR domain